MDEIIREIKKAIKELTGNDPMFAGGRSAEVNLRIARLMGKEIASESPADEYAKFQAMARKVTR